MIDEEKTIPERIKVQADKLLETLISQGIVLAESISEGVFEKIYYDGMQQGFFAAEEAIYAKIQKDLIDYISDRELELFRKNYYVLPPEEDVVEMKALEMMEERIYAIIAMHRSNKAEPGLDWMAFIKSGEDTH